MPKARPTIVTIAEACGVTDGTVSRALRGDPRVREETRRRVLQAAERLGYRPWTLPWARVAKGWSLVKNALGGVGPIPEGMSAASALRHQAFGEIHARLKAAVLQQAEGFRRREGYRPPYWELRRLARSARAEPPGLVEPL